MLGWLIGSEARFGLALAPQRCAPACRAAAASLPPPAAICAMPRPPPHALPVALIALYHAAAKTDRLKQAKDEAEREIAVFKSEREAEFKGKVRGVGSSKGLAAHGKGSEVWLLMARCGCSNQGLYRPR